MCGCVCVSLLGCVLSFHPTDTHPPLPTRLPTTRLYEGRVFDPRRSGVSVVGPREPFFPRTRGGGGAIDLLHIEVRLRLGKSLINHLSMIVRDEERRNGPCLDDSSVCWELGFGRCGAAWGVWRSLPARLRALLPAGAVGVFLW